MKFILGEGEYLSVADSHDCPLHINLLIIFILTLILLYILISLFPYINKLYIQKVEFFIYWIKISNLKKGNNNEQILERQ